MKNFIFFILTALVLVFVNSCAIDGPIGPEGPAGPVGPVGPQGNANVLSTTYSVSNWNYSAPSWQASIPFSAITQSIINTGAVLVYISTGTNTYSQLPLTFYPASTYSTTIEVVSTIGAVNLFWSDSDQTQPNNPGSWTFKVVAIAGSNKMAYPVDWSNYIAVKKYFNLAD